MLHADQVILQAIPDGLPKASDFGMARVALPEPGAGQVHLETVALSLDPYMRGQMSGRHMSGALALGDVLRGEAVCRVVASHAADIVPGQLVRAFCGWRSAAVMDASAMLPIGFDGLPPSLSLGVLGMPGLTAYAGLTRLGGPQPGDTVLVSSAAGTVGATVGQIARLLGCRTVGIAGGAHKCSWVRDAARFDACIDYKSETLRDAIARTCPSKSAPLGGVDVYFDNVGGDQLVAACEHLAFGARVVLCGLIDQYNRAAPAPGPNPGLIIRARAHVHGMVVYDHEDLRHEMIAKVSTWIRAGDLVTHEEITHGLDQAAAAFIRLLSGEGFGKAIVQIS